MNRFTVVFAAGSLMLLGGQALLSLGLHPEHLAPFPLLGQGILGLVLGSALAVSGLLGLAEGYEKAAARLRPLLGARQLADPVAVKTAGDLAGHGRSFWRSYQKSSLGLSLFLAGLLALSAALSRAEFLFYLVAIGSGIALLGLVALSLVVQGLAGLRRTWQTVEQAAVVLESQPPVAPPALPVKPVRKWTPYSKSERLHQLLRNSSLPGPP